MGSIENIETSSGSGQNDNVNPSAETVKSTDGSKAPEQHLAKTSSNGAQEQVPNDATIQKDEPSAPALKPRTREHVATLEKRLASLEQRLGNSSMLSEEGPSQAPPAAPRPASVYSDWSDSGDEYDPMLEPVLHSYAPPPPRPSRRSNGRPPPPPPLLPKIPALFRDGLDQKAQILRVPVERWRAKRPKPTWKSEYAVLVSSQGYSGSAGDLDEKPLDDKTESKPAGTDTSTTEIIKDDAVESSIGKPIRLCLNSWILRQVLMEVTGQTITMDRFVFTRPFKHLVAYEQQIRARLQDVLVKSKDAQEALAAFETELETKRSAKENLEEQSKDNSEDDRKIDSTHRAEVEPNEGPNQQPKERPTEQLDSVVADPPNGLQDERALEAKKRAAEVQEKTAAQLRCIIDFMETDMKEIFDVNSRIKAGTISDIGFEDLWMLFKPGDVVLGGDTANDEPHQAYRVLHVTGGRAVLDVNNRAKVQQQEKNSARYYRTLNWTPEDDGEDMLYTHSRNTAIAIDCFYLDSNGNQLGPRPKRFVITEYSGKLPITSLDCFPLRFAPKADEVEHALVERGRRFVELVGGRRGRYNGPTIREPYVGRSYQDEVNSEIVADQASALDRFSKYLYEWQFEFSGGNIRNPTKADLREVFDPIDCGHYNCGACTDIINDFGLDADRRIEWVHSNNMLQYVNLRRDKIDNDVDRLLLLPPRVYGYALLNRKWYPLNIDLIETDYESHLETGFDDLVLPDGHKKLIKALVKNQIRKFSQAEPNEVKSSQITADTTMDLVRGKGKGLIVLLHGVPGVGKTSTAECVAASLRRPLFPVTCGDLGTFARDVENALVEYFTLAHRWGCVLLLDEADVFLAKREKGGDIERNALVSVFLRVLEYYPGVLILTTNRVGEFDEAFKSRIHVSLYYPKLKQESTFTIWETHLRRIKESQMNVDLEEDKIRQFYHNFWNNNVKEKKSSRQWNGRQIKNAFQTAVALANWDFHDGAQGAKLKRPLVRAKHFELVATTGAHFDDYISDMYQITDRDVHAVLAEREEIRRDDRSDEEESDDPATRRRRKKGLQSRLNGGRRATRKEVVVEDEEDEGEDASKPSAALRKAEIELELLKLKGKKKVTSEDSIRIAELRLELLKLGGGDEDATEGARKRGKQNESFADDDEEVEDDW